MRLLLLIMLILAGSLVAAEPTPAYPLWDGSESVAEYANKVNLPATKTLDLGNGVNLELVLIPAGKFVMGTPEPIPVDEDGFHKRILTGQVLLAVSGVALLVMLTVVVRQAIRKRQRPKYSLLWFLLMIVIAGGCVLSGLHWRQSAKGLEAAKLDFAAAMAWYNSASPCEKPVHPVTLTNPFYMGKFAVTQGQYKELVDTNPSKFKSKNNPVETVSWDDAVWFCKRLSEKTKEEVRLPTEAEWEYACRAGTTTAYYTGEGENNLDRVAWYGANSNNTTHSVGQKEPNAFGLFDMHGNVWQWCDDSWSQNYYEKSPIENPHGPPANNFRVMRGGSWIVIPIHCRSSARVSSNPNISDEHGGFRVVVPASTSP